MARQITKAIPSKFADFVFDWDYLRYLLVGGYGSAKSYSIAMKIIMKLLEEKRKCLVVRQVYGSIRESCFDLFKEILHDMDMVANWDDPKDRVTKVRVYEGSLQIKFPNGSRIVFKGLDDPMKIKSINGVSIVWLEECSEINYEAYKELLGRLRTPDVSLHFILSCNPVGKENWVYRHFFKRLLNDGKEKIILDDKMLYRRGNIVKGNTYYHHSTVDDNPFVPSQYIKTLDEIKEYDEVLWSIARHGQFGTAGIRVLPQLRVAEDAKQFVEAVRAINIENHYFGMDFGFEDSFNAVISMAVDNVDKILYIYDEIYVNKLTDDKMAARPDMQALKNKQMSWVNNLQQHNPIVADNEDPKAIKYYRDMGFEIRGCRNKFAGSRLSNTRKIKRFRKIIVSPKCINTIRELRGLVYKKDKAGNMVYDEFNIDPHTFSAIWYGLDMVTVSDPKEIKSNSRSGNDDGKFIV